MNVASVLKSKGNNVVTVNPDTSTQSIVGRMKLDHIGSVVVSETGSNVIGLVSERDVAYGLARHGSELLNMRAADFMSSATPTCKPEDSLTKVMVDMTQHRKRHLPVIDQGELAGIVSIGDVVKHRLEELAMEADVLRDLYLASH